VDVPARHTGGGGLKAAAGAGGLRLQQQQAVLACTHPPHRWRWPEVSSRQRSGLATSFCYGGHIGLKQQWRRQQQKQRQWQQQRRRQQQQRRHQWQGGAAPGGDWRRTQTQQGRTGGAAPKLASVVDSTPAGVAGLAGGRPVCKCCAGGVLEHCVRQVCLCASVLERGGGVTVLATRLFL
jgi:hypothetical protein